jgi:ATP-dependent DNA helicase PIF1
MHQHDAFTLLKMGKNIFLTGAAGSGKTYLLNQYIQYLKDNHIAVAVTASTGIAATHLHGATIHSWSGIGVRDYLTDKDLDKLLTKSHIKRNYKRTKVLIIDEISMLHKHQLDMIDTVARFMLNTDQPFGGLQVILCGDFFQLPPVFSNSSSIERQFAFESAAWKNSDFHVCYLHEQHRQQDDTLLTILNDIRGGTAGEHTKVPLRTRYKKEPQGAIKATKLYSKNINVEAINNDELAQIAGQEQTFKMITRGFNTLVESLKKSCLALEQLKLKIGADVMFIKNDATGRYVNGTRAVVIAFEKSAEGLPVVKTYDHKIITVHREEWTYEDNGVVRATLIQIPLRLAWAITIHKSQGMTLDAAEIDLGDAFEPGMGYVALSRVRRLDGLKLMNLNEIALKVHPKILQQDNIFKEDSNATANYLQALSEEEKMVCYQKILERFAGGKTKTKNKSKKTSSVSKNKVPTHLTTLDMLKEKLSLEMIAEQRGISVGTIMSHLEKLKGLKILDHSLIEHVINAIPKEDFAVLSAELKQSQDGKLRPIFDKFAGKYAYVTIQLVRLCC